jgi:hypothetical protein
VGVWSGFIWLRIGTSGGLLLSGVMYLQFWRHRVGWLVILYVGNGTVSGVGGTTYHIRQCL